MDIQNLTLGEIARVEEISGQPLADLAEDNKPRGALLAALAFVIKRRTDPKFTHEDAKALTMSDIEELITGDGDAKKE